MHHLATLYHALVAAGQAFGITDFGTYAVNSLRMEKAYRGWGAELTNELTPFEAGLGRLVNFDKGDFIGREGCLAARDQGCKIQLVYLAVDALDIDVRGGDAVFFDGKVVGVTTSGGYGHAVGRSLAFAYVPAELASAACFEIQIFGERRAAEQLPLPAYDPDTLRLRA